MCFVNLYHDAFRDLQNQQLNIRNLVPVNEDEEERKILVEILLHNA